MVPRQLYRVYNRILEVMMHTSRYAFKGQARLAHDTGTSRSTISRLVNGQSVPSYPLVHRITEQLEKHVGRKIDHREVISLDGKYPTPCVCDLVGCKGCMPDAAFDIDQRLKPEYRDVAPGKWSNSPVYNPQNPPDTLH